MKRYFVICYFVTFCCFFDQNLAIIRKTLYLCIQYCDDGASYLSKCMTAKTDLHWE